MKLSAVESILQDEVISVFTSNRTTIPERACVVYKWMESDFDFYTHLAAEKQIEPIILLIASILDSEDRILSPNGKPCKKSLSELCRLLLESELIKAMDPGRDMAEIVEGQLSECSHNPVDNSLESVDNLAFSVDKGVYNPVDNLGTYQQPRRKGRKLEKLSTPC